MLKNTNVIAMPAPSSNASVKTISCGIFLLLFLGSGIEQAFGFVKLLTPQKCHLLRGSAGALSRSTSRSTSGAAGERRTAVIEGTGASITTAFTATSEVGEIVAAVADVWEGFEAKDHDRFLREYWQKKPLLIRQAVPGFESIVSKDELAGLACLEDVESRIVWGAVRSAGIAEDGGGSDEWEVEHGPFDEGTFTEVMDWRSHWTLLVNEVNRHIPEVSDLLDMFRFVPNWRVDDVMISYAPQGGSVGPHVDNYDVFLLQGAGKRRWSIEDSFMSDDDEKSRCIPDIDLRVLSDFSEKQAWILEAGDALYLPPRLAHHGVSMDEECMTYSIGFRAPSVRDLVSFFGDHVASTVTRADEFYADPDLRKQENPGLIDRGATLAAKGIIRKAILSALDDGDTFDRWFGSHVTRSRRDHTGYPMPIDDDDGLSFGYQAPEDVTAALKRSFRKERESGGGEGLGPFVYHAEGLTFAYLDHEGVDTGLTLFVDGNPFPLPQELAAFAGVLCAAPRLSPKTLGPALEGEEGGGAAELLHSLLKEGYLYPADD